jgi:SprT-like protein
VNLTDYVQEVSREDFGRPFQHEARWNPRLRTTGGRFFPKDGHLDFNPKMLDAHGLALFRKIVRHELCHYHLFFEKKGYRHGDRDFKNLLQEVGGLRFAPQIEERVQSFHHYSCQSCGQLYQRRRRINTQKYRCGRCQGQLITK